jgi:hypothetical protein
MQEAKEIKSTANKQKGLIGGFTVAELAKLKALGMLPKHLLTVNPLKENGKEEKGEDGTGSVR